MSSQVYLKLAFGSDKSNVMIIFITISLVLIFILTLGCRKKQCDIIETYDSGKKKVIACVADSSFCYDEYFENGMLKATYCLKNNDYHGTVKKYDSTGVLRSIIEYRSGLRHGTCYKFDQKERPLLLNFCLNGKTIFLKSYEYSSSGMKVEYNFDPVLSLENDTILPGEEELFFEVELPIPDSLIAQNYSTLKYGLKPIALKDSIVLDAPFESRLYYNKPYIGSVKVDKSKTHELFYCYLYDEDKNAVYGLKEKVIYVINL